MNRLIAMVLAGVLLGTVSVAGVQAQVGIDVGGGVSGSAGGGDAAIGASTDIDVSVGTGGDTPTSSEDTSSRDISFTLSQDDAASVSLDAESAERSAASVSTSDDLSVYATSKMKRDMKIESVDASSDHVSLTYRKNARFLGFIPGSIRATAEVRADGTVDIDYPWYRFLFAVEGSDNIEADLQARVQEVMADANGTLTARVEAELLDALHSSLAGAASVSAESATTADMAGPSDTEFSGDASGDISGEVYPQ